MSVSTNPSLEQKASARQILRNLRIIVLLFLGYTNVGVWDSSSCFFLSGNFPPYVLLGDNNEQVLKRDKSSYKLRGTGQWLHSSCLRVFLGGAEIPKTPYSKVFYFRNIQRSLICPISHSGLSLLWILSLF